MFSQSSAAPSIDRISRPGGERVVILGHGAWQRRFGGDASIVGRSISLNTEAHTVIGVLPEAFEFPLRGLTELWLPLVPSRRQVERRYWHWLDAIGRLRTRHDNRAGAGRSRLLRARAVS